MSSSVGEPVNTAVYKAMGIDLNGPAPRDLLAATVFVQVLVYRRMMGAASGLERQGEQEQANLRKAIDVRGKLANLVGKLDKGDDTIEKSGLHVRDQVDMMFAINRDMEGLNLAGATANPRIFDAASKGWVPKRDGIYRESLFLAGMHAGWDDEVFGNADAVKSLRGEFSDESAEAMGNVIRATILASPGEANNPVKDLSGKEVMDLIFSPRKESSRARVPQLQAQKAFVDNYYNIENRLAENLALKAFWQGSIAEVGKHFGDKYFDQALRSNCRQISGGIHSGTKKVELQAAVDALNSEINLRSTNNGQTLEKTSVAFSQASSCIESALQSVLKLFAAFNAAGTRL